MADRNSCKEHAYFIISDVAYKSYGYNYALGEFHCCAVLVAIERYIE